MVHESLNFLVLPARPLPLVRRKAELCLFSAKEPCGHGTCNEAILCYSMNYIEQEGRGGGRFDVRMPVQWNSVNGKSLLIENLFFFCGREFTCCHARRPLA